MASTAHWVVDMSYDLGGLTDSQHDTDDTTTGCGEWWFNNNIPSPCAIRYDLVALTGVDPTLNWPPVNPGDPRPFNLYLYVNNGFANSWVYYENPYTLGSTVVATYGEPGNHNGYTISASCYLTGDAGCGGDPHCVGLDGQHFEFHGQHGSSYTLYHSPTLTLNGTLQQFKLPQHALDRIAHEHADYYANNFLTAFSQLFLRFRHPRSRQTHCLHLDARHPDWSGFQQHKGQPPVPLAMIPGAEGGTKYHSLATPRETLHAWSISLHNVPYLNFWISSRLNSPSGILGQTLGKPKDRLPHHAFLLPSLNSLPSQP